MSYALRPALPADFADLGILFQASIEELASDAYSDEQRALWGAKADDEKAWAKHLSGCLVLIAEEDGEPVGFAAMRDNAIIENVHVHPDMAFMGVGRQLLDALERLAMARGAKKLSVAATDNALPFFERLGFVAMRRSTLSIGEEWLPSMVMDKALAANTDDEA
ncbi:MAG: GNAT family N-acetyltransferase [Hyphomicrobiales bacterium]|nr:GNAT family N-acetyltransferase [Hyphomicrobiales bacterium]